MNGVMLLQKTVIIEFDIYQKKKKCNTLHFIYILNRILF